MFTSCSTHKILKMMMREEVVGRSKKDQRQQCAGRIDETSRTHSRQRQRVYGAKKMMISVRFLVICEKFIFSAP